MSNPNPTFCPSDIEVLLHYHVSPDPHPRIEAPAVADGIRRLKQLGLLEDRRRDNVYTTTDKGRVHIEQLCTMPLPVFKWVNANIDEG